MDGIIPDNPLAGSPSLGERWRPDCGHFRRLSGVHGPSYGLPSSGKTASQPTLPSSRVLRDDPGLYLVCLRVKILYCSTGLKSGPGNMSAAVVEAEYPRRGLIQKLPSDPEAEGRVIR